MEKFISKKVVHAEEMTSDKWLSIRSHFFKHSDASLPSGLDGYHVVYSMGTDEEYHSWSPKSNFENGNIKAGKTDCGINHDDGIVDIIFGDGMTGVQSLGYEELDSGKFGMAGIVICRDGNHDEPFGFNEEKNTYLSGEEKVFIRADSAKSIQVIIDRLEEAKSFLE